MVDDPVSGVSVSFLECLPWALFADHTHRRRAPYLGCTPIDKRPLNLPPLLPPQQLKQSIKITCWDSDIMSSDVVGVAEIPLSDAGEACACWRRGARLALAFSGDAHSQPPPPL